MKSPIWLIALAAFPCFAQFPGETERLMATTRLWVTVEYFHPYLAYRDIEWDNALVAAIPKIRAATNDVMYRAAITDLLNELHDPETHVATDQSGPLKPSADSSPQITWVHTASDSAFQVKQSDHGEEMLMDLLGFKAVVRLSEPFRSGSSPPAPIVRPPNNRYSEAYPPTEARLLAAIKMWGAIHYFFAYKDLIDEDWDEVFASYLTKFIEARDATDYNLTFADLLTHLTDSNTAPHSKTLDTYFGEARIGLNIRMLDKYPIVTDVLDPAAAEAGVRPGDVLKRIGNESVTDRFRRFVQYIPASTADHSGYDTIQRVTNGPAGTELDLAIENAQGEAHVVKLTRKNIPPAPQRSTEAVRIVPGNIGYMDLDRVTSEGAEEALARLKDTKAIIFDLRGTAAAGGVIARHLTSQQGIASALVTTPIALHPDVATEGIATQTSSTFLVQTLPAPRPPLYKGKTVALIDERTIGQAESAGLQFEAANKTEFVGVPSAGADSILAELPLPGGIVITYSTQDIRHANGGKLQRLGLQPNINALTTAKGLHAGKDETLDAALSYLSR